MIVEYTTACVPSLAEKGSFVGREFNVLALVKGCERYVFVYDDASGEELLASFKTSAADPSLSFNWFDAAVLTEKAREQMENAPRSRLV